jgi:hypothetical protein
MTCKRMFTSFGGSFVTISEKMGLFFAFFVLKFKICGQKMKFRNKNIYFRKKFSYIYY